MAEKVYDNEMRGSLWAEKDRTNDKAPTATGSITISGVELRLAMWPNRKAGGNGKRSGEDFWPISVEYRQGTKFVLAKVNPANIVVTGATASAEASTDPVSAEAPGEQAAQVDDMPF